MKLFAKFLFLAGCLAFCLSNYAQDMIQHFRHYDQRGINVFETSKEDTVGFEQLRVRIGGGFTQQLQGLRHENNADRNVDPDTGADRNELYPLDPGFNLATANMNMDVQLADGVRLNLVIYLSARHHPEAWVKGGYVQLDKLPFLNSNFFDKIMETVTLKIGHMEINYGDAHFRRTDNGLALYNPFVGNLIMDAFTTEIGAEVYWQKNGLLAMVAGTGGEIQGSVTAANRRSPSFYGKFGYDDQLSPDLRIRLTGSVYMTEKSISNTLYGGDRGGSRYYYVMENTAASASSNFTSGRINPGFRDKVTAIVFNPFIKFKGLEFFGNIEFANGRARNETADRKWNQLSGDLLYRFGKREQFYFGGRYTVVGGELAGSGTDVSANRVQIAGGWFLTKNVLAKLEYVNQNYVDYPSTSILSEGTFNGIMLEATIGF